jgi:hypothetical protein
LSETPEPSITIDVWVVPDGTQEAFMDVLVSLFERLRTLDGFIDGQILRGLDPTLFVSYATLRSAEDRDAAFLDHEIQVMMRTIGGIARANPHAYTVARTFTPAVSGGD